MILKVYITDDQDNYIAPIMIPYETISYIIAHPDKQEGQIKTKCGDEFRTAEHFSDVVEKYNNERLKNFIEGYDKRN